MPIDEHAQPVGKPEPTGNPQEESVVQMVNNLLQRSKRASQSARSEWGPNYRFMHGGQWSVHRPVYRFSEVVNVTWSTIMQEVAIQTDSSPRVEFLANDPGDFAFAEVLSQVNEQNWIKYSWPQIVQGLLIDCKIFHVAHAEVCWNQDLENGLGDIELKILDPFYCYWDPLACDVGDSRYFMYAAPVPTSELQRKHPKVEIKPDIGSLGYTTGTYESRIAVDQDRLKSTHTTSTFRASSTEGSSQYGGEPMTMLIRCWIKDDAVEEYVEEKELPDGQTDRQYVLKKKYPKGRYIEVAGNNVLRDGPNGAEMPDGTIVPYEDGEFPIARLVNYSYAREYAGECEVSHLRGPQRTINYIWSYMIDVMKKSCSPQKVVGFGAGIDDLDKITDEPGLIIEAKDVNQVRMEYGPGVPASMSNLLDIARNFLDTVQGITESSRGASDPGVKSGIFFEGIVEASQTRSRMKNRTLSTFLQRVGKLMLSRYLQFYTVSRTFRMTNKEGFPEFTEFFITKEGGKTIANVSRGTMMEGQLVDQGSQQMEMKGVPDVKVVSGSSLPFSKALKTSTAKELFAAGAIDQTELLEAIEWPNHQAVVDRMQKAAAEQAALAPPEGA